MQISTDLLHMGFLFHLLKLFVFKIKTTDLNNSTLKLENEIKIYITFNYIITYLIFLYTTLAKIKQLRISE